MAARSSPPRRAVGDGHGIRFTDTDQFIVPFLMLSAHGSFEFFPCSFLTVQATPLIVVVSPAVSGNHVPFGAPVSSRPNLSSCNSSGPVECWH